MSEEKKKQNETKQPTNKKKLIIRYGLGIGIGALLGFAYWYFIGCTSGHCPLTSNPYITTGYGAAVGFVAVMK